jgi:hypothetical protein
VPALASRVTDTGGPVRLDNKEISNAATLRAFHIKSGNAQMAMYSHSHGILIKYLSRSHSSQSDGVRPNTSSILFATCPIASLYPSSRAFCIMSSNEWPFIVILLGSIEFVTSACEFTNASIRLEGALAVHGAHES